ncbi:MAG: T9SS type A sorting domain-containing protein [Bacteroidota bacterium]
MNTVHAQNFFPLPPGFNAQVRTLYYDSTNNLLYVGGNFWALHNGQPMNYISRWNGVSWDSLASGVDDSQNVISLIEYNGNLIASGVFSQIGGIQSKGLAKWDGINWQFFTNATSQFGYGCVWTLFVDNNDLYIGGCFDTVNGIAAKSFARYDGNSWYSYPPLNFVQAIAKYNGEIYVAGDFNAGAGKKDIVKWDGTNWVSVGGGFSGPNSWVNCMTVYQGDLYVGGYFFTTQGDPGNTIAIWNGTNWSQPGNGLMPSNVDAHVFKNELYAGGQILDASGISVTYIAKWNGSNWFSLGSTFSTAVSSFASNGNDLYIGGGFLTIDGDTMMCITRYSPPLGIEENSWNTSGITITPNPNKGNFSLTSLFYPIESIRLFDLSGRVFFSKDKILSNSYECKLKSPDGIYIAEVFMNKKAYRNKILILH